jgi:FkbM family methyltransferase
VGLLSHLFARRAQEKSAAPARSPDSGFLLSATDAELIAVAAEEATEGQLARSLAHLNARLVGRQDEPELLYARALTLLDWGRVREAGADLRAAEARGLSSVALHINLAQICHLQGLAEEAERRLRQAIALDESSAKAHRGLGLVLQGAKRYDEASASYERARELAPEDVDLPYEIATCKLDQGDGPGAETVIRAAISRLGDDQPRFHSLLGVALTLQNRADEAMQSFRRAEELEQRSEQPPEAFIMHAFHALGSGRLTESLGTYARYLASSGDPGAHANCGLALLTAGRLPEGWPLYEFRWCYERLAATRPRFGRPQWRGQSLRNKVLLVWAEQGVGDTVQFARFVERLQPLGGRAVLLVSRRLREFAQGFRGVDRVISDLSELAEGFDYYTPSMSLPGALGVDLEAVQVDVPYLAVDADRRSHWRKRLGSDSNLKVGIAWAGNPTHERDRYRSILFTQIQSLLDIDGVQWYSLQKERRAGDMEGRLAGRLIDLAPELIDFRDTAAAIDALDLVVAVDTAIVHIAGALAKPVWVMLPAGPDFRWMTERLDSPWYPTMRLFRQQRLGDWSDLLASVRGAVDEAARAHRAGGLSVGVPRASSTSSAQELSLEAVLQQLPLSRLGRVADTRYGILQYSPREEKQARALEAYGEWLQPQLALLAKLLRPDATVLEVAGGIGAHTLAIAAIVGPTGHVLAYETDPMLRQVLSENLRLNGVSNTCTVMRGRLSGPSGASPRREVQSPSRFAGATQLPTETVDELMLERLDLIKINADAPALEILEGAAETAWRLRPLVLASARDEASVALGERMKSLGYRCWRVVTPTFVPTNYNRCVEDLGLGTQSALISVPEEAEPGPELQAHDEIR